MMYGRLDKVPLEHQIMRRKAVGLLLGGTHAAIESLQGDEEELMRGAACIVHCLLLPTDPSGY